MPPLPPSMFFGIPGGSTHSEKMNGLNLNPLAPAQSELSFSLSRKTRNSIENASFQLSCSVLFCTFFKYFPEKSQKGSRVPPQSFKKTPKWIPGVPKRRPRIQKWSPKVPPSNKKHDKCLPRVSKWRPKCYNGLLRSLKVQKKHTKRSPEMLLRHEIVLQSCKKPTRHIDTNKQTTKQTQNKQTNKQTSKQTHTHTNKHPNNKTTSFALQTQTQTPAAGCSPKAT